MNRTHILDKQIFICRTSTIYCHDFASTSTGTEKGVQKANCLVHREFECIKHIIPSIKGVPIILALHDRAVVSPHWM